MSRQFWLVNFFGLLAFFGTYALTLAQRSDLLNVAVAMQTESWYRIDLHDEHVGYMRTHFFQRLDGSYQFDTTTHFQLDASQPNTITKSLRFEAVAPFRLAHADYQSAQPGNVVAVQASLVASGYAADVQRNEQHSTIGLDWQYTLADFLAFEYWLDEQPRNPGAIQSVKNLDFERLQLTKRAFRTIEHTETGYLVETNSPLSATTTQLDRYYVPVHLKMAGLFDISATDAGSAVPTRKVESKPHYLFPVDQRLRDHTEISSLEIDIVPPLPDIFPGGLSLDATQYTSRTKPKDNLGPTLRLPTGADEIKSLLTQLDSNLPPVAALVKLTHQLLQYAEGRPAPDVLTALAQGYGECTDFADLLTTLARTANMPARTVYGLAYRDASAPAFVFHTWNEIYDGKRWQAVDPTWNQVQIDATHILLNSTQSARMMHALNTQGITFQVRSIEYF